MARFEVFIPAAEPDGINMTLRVTADTWMAALKVGLKKIGEAQGMPKDVLCDIQDDESIHVTDPRTNRVFRILQIPDVSNPGLAPVVAPKSPWMSAPSDPHPSGAAAAPTEQKTVPEFAAPTPAEIAAALAAQKATDKLAAQRADAAKKAHEKALAEKAAAEAAAAERAAAEAQAAKEKVAAEKAAAERSAQEARLSAESAAAEKAVAKAKVEREAVEKAAAIQRVTEKAAAEKAAEKTAKARAAAERAAAEAQAAADQAEADQAAMEQAAADKVNAQRVAEMARAVAAKEKKSAAKKPVPATNPDPDPDLVSTVAKHSVREKERPVTVKVVDKPKLPPPAQIGRLQPTTADTQQVEETLSELFERTPELFQKPLAEALYYLLDLAMEKVPVDSGTVYVADLNRHDLGFAAVRGPKAKELLALKLRVPMGKGFVGFCAQEGVAVAMSDVHRDKRFFREISDRIGYDTRSMITTPIILHGRTLGAIQLINKKGSSSFSQAELSILHYLAHQGALLLEAAE